MTRGHRTATEGIPTKTFMLIIIMLVISALQLSRAEAAGGDESEFLSPIIVKREMPEYPDKLKDKKIQGDVHLRVSIDPSGKVKQVTLVKSLHKILDRLAIRSVQEWEFKPAERDGKPVAHVLPIRVRFRLDQPVKQGKLYKSRGYIDPVLVIEKVQPEYPEQLKEKKVSGVVTLGVMINELGQVSSVEVKSSSGDDRLDKAAVSAYKQWKFLPMLEDGRPTSARMYFTVTFSDKD